MDICPKCSSEKKARLWHDCLLSRGSKDNLARGILKNWSCPERSRRDAVVLFTKLEGIHPTNNIAEQSLRSLVLSRKSASVTTAKVDLRQQQVFGQLLLLRRTK